MEQRTKEKMGGKQLSGFAFPDDLSEPLTGNLSWLWAEGAANSGYLGNSTSA